MALSHTQGFGNSVGQHDPHLLTTAMWALAAAIGIGVIAAFTMPPALFMPVLSVGSIVVAAFAGLYAWMQQPEHRLPALIFAATLTFVGIAASMIGDPDHVAHWF